ncbi:DNA polymerase [Ovoidimarina sediminis]|uniref:DNA polymerase n=1 Tax=Ovoidimarina sediminis TaxID=3079856 RepID=UPI00290850CE|nr:DNA polymerase [Rhodophyticola sp. MJ-SS7]MDU8943485.1 DNA polymerase [Rhodophyticola sp. MJ-SS7]
MIIIGFDSEYVKRGERNAVLSYQYAVKTEKGLSKGIVYTSSEKDKDKLTFDQLIARAIMAARDDGVLDRTWPNEVYACAHFSRADFASFKDYKKLSRSLDALRGTYASLAGPLKRSIYDSSRNKHLIDVHCRDTLTISPGGSSLSALGDLLGLPKIEINSAYKSSMDKLLQDDSVLFEQYAIRDAEIAAEFAWKLAEFSDEQGQGFMVPLTLGSIANNLLFDLWDANGISSDAVLGKETVKEKKFINGRYHTQKKLVSLAKVHENEALATECYHGGRNEAFCFGPSHFDFWTDIDISGAYSTAMAAIRTPDWEKLYHTKKVKDFRKNRLALARVKFKFPDDCLYPCLPIRTDNGLIFPLEGESNCGSPEIELARSLGAKLKIQSGFIVPWADKTRPFELFSKMVRSKRKDHKKGSIFERAWKEIGNSLYGKVAQGLQEKRVFDSRSNDSKPLPPSKITQPFLAAYITSIVRATLGELLTRIPEGKEAISATTDGFITNAVAKDMDLSGPLCTFFAGQAKRLTGKRDIIEVKHVVPQVMCMKTRGQLTIGVLDSALPALKAKAGVSIPKEATEDKPDDKDILENNWLLELFLLRTPKTEVLTRQLTSMREMHLKDSDLLMEERWKKISLEFDWKRELHTPEMIKVGKVISGNDYEHISLKSKPHRKIEDFKDSRERFDSWRKNNCLVTEDDWNAWEEFRKRAVLRASGAITGKGALVDQCKRQFLKDFAHDKKSIKRGTYEELADWLTSIGYPTSINDVKNAKRSKSDVHDWSKENDKAVQDLIAKLEDEYGWRGEV